VTGSDDEVSTPESVDVVRADPAEPRGAVESVLALLRGRGGRTIVGIDPGERPGIAVLRGRLVVAAFQVSADRAAEVVREEIEDAVDPLVRVGDGARLTDMGDVLAAVNIAHIEGDRVEERDVEPTAGELQRIKDRSREQSERNRAIDEGLARKVAVGELTMGEALDEHRER
jgi:hypothetical protein